MVDLPVSTLDQHIELVRLVENRRHNNHPDSSTGLTSVLLLAGHTSARRDYSRRNVWCANNVCQPSALVLGEGGCAICSTRSAHRYNSGSRGIRPFHPWTTANRRNRGLQRCVWPLDGPTGNNKRLGWRFNSGYLSPTAGTSTADTPSADWGRHARCSRLGRHSRCTLQSHPMHTTALKQISFASARWGTAAAQERAQILHRNAGCHPQKPDPACGWCEVNGGQWGKVRGAYRPARQRAPRARVRASLGIGTNPVVLAVASRPDCSRCHTPRSGVTTNRK